MRDGTALLSGSLRNQCTLADLKLNRMLDAIDEWATAQGLDGEVEAPHRPEPTFVEPSPPLAIPLGTGDIKTVIWATGLPARLLLARRCPCSTTRATSSTTAA